MQRLYSSKVLRWRATIATRGLPPELVQICRDWVSIIWIRNLDSYAHPGRKFDPGLPQQCGPNSTHGVHIQHTKSYGNGLFGHKNLGYYTTFFWMT